MNHAAIFTKTGLLAPLTNLINNHNIPEVLVTSPDGNTIVIPELNFTKANELNLLAITANGAPENEKNKLIELFEMYVIDEKEPKTVVLKFSFTRNRKIPTSNSTIRENDKPHNFANYADFSCQQIQK